MKPLAVLLCCSFALCIRAQEPGALKLAKTIPLSGIKGRFDAMHAQRYGTSAPAERAEIVSLRITVIGVLRKPKLQKLKKGQQGLKFGFRESGQRS